MVNNTSPLNKSDSSLSLFQWSPWHSVSFVLAIAGLAMSGVLGFFSVKTLSHVVWRPGAVDTRSGNTHAGIKTLDLGHPFAANRIELSFRFRPESFPVNANVFQTADVNEGLRMELSVAGGVGFAMGSSNASGLRGLSLPITLVTGQWHDMRLRWNAGQTMTVWMDGRIIGTFTGDDLQAQISRLAVGTGFSRTRNFDGQITGFVFRAWNERPRHRVQSASRFLRRFCSAALCVLILIRMMTRLSRRVPQVAWIASLTGLLTGWILLTFFSVKVIGQVSWTPDDYDSRSPTSSAIRSLDLRQRAGNASRMTITFRLRPASFPPNANVFQTADVNAGLRMEVATDGHFGLDMGSTLPAGLRGFAAPMPLAIGTWYTFIITWNSNQGLSLLVDGQNMGTWKGADLQCQMSQLAMGAGFSKTRIFDGQIADFKLHAVQEESRIRVTAVAHALITVSAWILCLLGFCWVGAHVRWDLRPLMRRASPFIIEGVEWRLGWSSLWTILFLWSVFIFALPIYLVPEDVTHVTQGAALALALLLIYIRNL